MTLPPPLQTLHDEATGLLAVAPGHDEASAASTATALLRHELAPWRSVEALSTDHLQRITGRLRYFAAHDWLDWRCARAEPDHLRRERLLLYVQEKLQQDSFRRLLAWDPARGAKLTTYLSRITDNLIIDWQRQQRGETRSISPHHDIAADGSIGSGDEGQRQQPAADQPAADQQLDSATLRDWLSGLLNDPGAASPLAVQIGTAVRLNPREALFLKAVYCDDLNPEQAGRLPGMQLTRNAAYALQRRLLERIAAALKELNLYADLQRLLDVGPNELPSRQHGVIAAEDLLLVTRQEQEAAAQLHVADTAVATDIPVAWKLLIRRLYAWCSPISTTALAGDAWLEKLDADGQLHIRLLADPVPVATRLRPALRERLRHKSAPQPSVSETPDGAPT